MRFLIFIACISCSFSQNNKKAVSKNINCCKDIALPSGYLRTKSNDSLFAQYLRNIQFKADNQVLLYDGSPKYNQDAQYRVLNLGVGKKNLQQCADAVIRLRAEYLFKSKRFTEIKFHFTSGHFCKWLDYAEGFRPQISGNSVNFNKSAPKDNSEKSFIHYLDLIYTYCGTASLHKELNPKNIKSIEVGDVLIKTGNPYGHAVIVMDVAKNKFGERIFILAQSYMPAQEIHILKNTEAIALNPWYKAIEGTIETPEWTFSSGDLRTW